jgi:cell division protein FtsI (penicillin-binding protein 3)
VRPRLVLKKGDQTTAPATPVRVLRPETAITMRQLMEGVVINPQGTGHRARLTGYSSGGKTGSAQIFDFATKHYTHSYNGSFLGFAPVTNPAIVVVVTLNGTHGEGGFGGVVAAPVFHEIATEALRVMEVPKDLPDEPVKTLVAKKEQVNDLADSDAETDGPNILEDGEEEEAGAPAGVVMAASVPRVPDFKGKTMRAVLAEAAEKGLTILPDGSGVARIQNPAAGAVLHQGERIRVQFSR